SSSPAPYLAERYAHARARLRRRSNHRPIAAGSGPEGLAGATPFSTSAQLRSRPNPAAGKRLFRLGERLLPGLTRPPVGVCQRHRGLVVDADVAGMDMDVLQSLRRTTECPLEGTDAGLLDALVELL